MCNLQKASEKGMSIRELGYTLYQSDWMNRVSIESELQTKRNYYKEGAYEDQSYDDYINDVGYDGSLFVCFDEFLDAEYQDKEYMTELFKDKDLIMEYEKDIKTLQYKQEQEW